MVANVRPHPGSGMAAEGRTWGHTAASPFFCSQASLRETLIRRAFVQFYRPQQAIHFEMPNFSNFQFLPAVYLLPVDSRTIGQLCVKVLPSQDIATLDQGQKVHKLMIQLNATSLFRGV